MKAYPALDIRSGDYDLVYAALDDLAPTAIEEREDCLRAFFGSGAARDLALQELGPQFDVRPVDVPDEDWARRSQQHLAAVRVGRFLVTPETPDMIPDPRPDPLLGPTITLCIRPSMGFGTGHHATTRLCLAALQTLDLEGKVFLDLGTGSGILAIAACCLGARAIGLDFDEDAIQSARENVTLDPRSRRDLVCRGRSVASRPAVCRRGRGKPDRRAPRPLGRRDPERDSARRFRDRRRTDASRAR